VLPVIIEAIVTISKPLKKYLSKMPGKQKINQGTADNSHAGHCTHTLESTYVKVPNMQWEVT
jgi:hypothetical protein